jgi:hypothetical protein
MAIAVVAIVAGLIVGVTIELLLANRHRDRRVITVEIETETLRPSPRGRPGLPQARFIEDGDGFRILGPLEYGEPGAIQFGGDETSGSSAAN